MVELLDAYGLSRDDMMETMREMQFTIEKDSVMLDYFEKLDSQVKVRTYVRTRASRKTDMYIHTHGHTHTHIWTYTYTHMDAC